MGRNLFYEKVFHFGANITILVHRMFFSVLFAMGARPVPIPLFQKFGREVHERKIVKKL